MTKEKERSERDLRRQEQRHEILLPDPRGEPSELVQRHEENHHSNEANEHGSQATKQQETQQHGAQYHEQRGEPSALASAIPCAIQKKKQPPSRKENVNGREVSWITSPSMAYLKGPAVHSVDEEGDENDFLNHDPEAPTQQCQRVQQETALPMAVANPVAWEDQAVAEETKSCWDRILPTKSGTRWLCFGIAFLLVAATVSLVAIFCACGSCNSSTSEHIVPTLAPLEAEVASSPTGNHTVANLSLNPTLEPISTSSTNPTTEEQPLSLLLPQKR